MSLMAQRKKRNNSSCLINQNYQMKALMKGNAAKYFQKKEKAVEDIEVVMNNIEAKVLAKFLGIAEFQIANFNDFFEQVAKLRLPRGYSRHTNPQKNRVFYLNQVTNEQTEIHPSLDMIKVAFYQMLSNLKTVYNFQIKSNKLLPFVEDKLMRQCFGLNSKRRDAEKNNVQRDQQGKVVISKMGRVKPDMKSLISSRSYMLKALVQKIYTKKEIWGKGKKANTYANIISAYRFKKNEAIEEEDDEESQKSLEKYQEIFQTSAEYYMELYGNLLYIPEEIKNTRSYFRSTPQSVLRNINLLNIDKQCLELFWLARLMQALPMSPDWKIKLGESFDQYVYEPQKLVFDLHPSYIYIVKQMNKFKNLFEDMDIIQQNYYTNMRQMVFYDFFERAYDVDILGLIQKQNQGPITRKRAFKKSNELGKNDWMALEAVRNLQLAQQEYPLIEHFQEYWGKLNYREQIYLPAISPFGQITWSSAINRKAMQICPHSATLSVIREQKLYDLPEFKEGDLKIYEEQGVSQEQYRQNQKLNKLRFQIYPEEREKFISYYLRNDPKPLSYPYQIPSDGNELDFYDQIFTCQFDLEQDLNLRNGEALPLWLQKVHAKKKAAQDCALLDWSQQTLEEAKNRFGQYAIEMTKEHEPEREEQVTKIIQEMQNIPSLKKFINYINDIDAREERKRLANIGVVEEKQDSLGSSLSQINMQEKMEEESQEQDSFDLNDGMGEDDESEEIEDDEKSSSQSILQKEVQEKKEEEILEVEQPRREPQKYESIIYHIDENIEGLSENDLNVRLRELVREKKLKHKYSQSNIRKIAEQIDVQTKSKEMKRNLLVSKLRSEKVPYKEGVVFETKRGRNIQTAHGLPDVSQDFTPFRSEASDYENSRMQSQIERWKQMNLGREESVQSEIHEPKKFIDETRQTIQLQPLKRMKPDIEEDQRLKHYSEAYNLSHFLKSFNSCKPQTLIKTKILNPQKHSLQKKKSYETEKKQQIIQRIDKETFLHRSSSLMSISNKSISPTKFECKFNRVCLGSTASSLLSTEPLLKRGDLILLEARKSLVSKGRGMDTIMSKNY